MFLSRFFKYANIINISWFVTWRCNASCDFCNLGNKNDDRFPELDTSKAILLIDDLFYAGIRRVSLVGGEPMMRNDIPELINALKDKNLNVSIVTNGLITRKEVIETCPNEINISLDFPDNRHDKVRNVEKAFERVCKALDFYARHKDKYNYKLGIGTVLLRENIDDLEKIIELAKTYKVSKVTIQPVLKPQIRYNDKISNLLFDEDDHNIFEIKEKIYMLKHNYGDFFATSNLFLRNIPIYLTKGRHDLFCFAGGTFTNISPSGEIMPCIFMESAGNLQEKSFKEIIKSKEYKKIHKRVTEGKCPCCLCPDIHEPNLIFSPIHWLEAISKAYKIR